MKLLDKLINFIFSLAMIIISVVILLVMFNLTTPDFVNGVLNDYLWNSEYRMVVIISSIVTLLAALKTTIFLADFKKKRKLPITVSTDNGNIQIAHETIESTAKAVAKNYEEVKDVNAKMVGKNKGVEIYMTILVSQDTNIRALTRSIQDEVKNKIHETTGVLVLNTDIKVKNIVEKGKKVSGSEASNSKEKVEENVEIKEESVIEQEAENIDTPSEN